MHCPRCGLQQASDEIQFCSRCGLQLGIVARLLANDGMLPELLKLNEGKSKIFTRRNGVAFSILWTMLFLFIFTPIWAILDVEELAAAAAVIGIFGGMMFLVSSIIFLRKSPAYGEFGSPYTPQYLGAAGNRKALSPQTTQPASTYAPPMGSWRAPETDELAAPGSVTESTTKLLHKEKEP